MGTAEYLLKNDISIKDLKDEVRLRDYYGVSRPGRVGIIFPILSQSVDFRWVAMGPKTGSGHGYHQNS